MTLTDDRYIVIQLELPSSLPADCKKKRIPPIANKDYLEFVMD